MERIKARLTATRFDFQLQLHALEPWPAGGGAVPVAWQRGRRCRGETRAAAPRPARRGAGAVVRFDEAISFEATLYKVPGTAERGGQLGPFKRKCVVLTILAAGGCCCNSNGGGSDAGAGAAVGRVVLDLSEFAAMDARELRTFGVAYAPEVAAAAGGPRLAVTLRCRWRDARADAFDDVAASQSTDRSGLSLGGSIKDFLSRASSGRLSLRGSRQSDQDLGSCTASTSCGGAGSGGSGGDAGTGGAGGAAAGEEAARPPAAASSGGPVAGSGRGAQAQGAAAESAGS